jgi:cytochrome oxidase Cu insertion factor (SCO1/SenC/PrrC family)
MVASVEGGDHFMRKLYIHAMLLAALALCGCQKTAQPDATSQTAEPAKAPSVEGDRAASQPPAAPVTHLKAGDPAPDFALTDTEGQTVRLSDFRGKRNVVLAFYVLAFTGG